MPHKTVTALWIPFSIFAGAFCYCPLLAIAPDSIVGKVFEHSPYIDSVRRGYFAITEFPSATTFHHVVWESGSVSDSSKGVVWKLGFNQPQDGTYLYQRISETQATLTESSPSGDTRSFDLVFTSPTSGTYTTPTNASASTTFTLVDEAEFHAFPLINTSVRGHVGINQPLIAGIIIPGTTPRSVVIRAVGPTLTKFGVTGVWTDPHLEIHSSNSTLSSDKLNTLAGVYFDDWSTDPAQVPVGTTEAALGNLFSYTGAFPFSKGSKDAVAFVRLDPGAYTIVCQAPAGDSGGDTLIEVYMVP